jgi:hypothetical protein
LKSLAFRQSFARSLPLQLYRPAYKIDDVFLKMFTSSSISSHNDHDNDGANVELEDPEGCLYPNFEYFENSTGTPFSETALLQFVKEKNGDNNNSSGGDGVKSLIPRLVQRKVIRHI